VWVRPPPGARSTLANLQQNLSFNRIEVIAVGIARD
jgi:hypothetical protein